MKVSPVSPALAFLSLLSAAYAEPAPKVKPRKEPPSAAEVAKAAVVAPGLQLDVWAAEPFLQNPVAFSFDQKGRAWVAETNRRKSSSLDIRSFPEWVADSLAMRSVEERVAFLKKALPEGALKGPKPVRDLNKDGKIDWHDLEVESEVVRLVEDKAGKGVADSSRVVADGFASVGTGVGAGIAARDGQAVYICEPDVWLLGEDGFKKSLLTGLAVHIVYSGHDCHGAKFGPDGRLYFSVGDCSARIESGGKVLAPPSSGAVFRCWPDGTGVELYAWGLRNPQSLVFNEVGDLFTGDNNADGGDKARWVHVVEGADYGWRFHYQFMKEPKLGVWNAEGLWKVEAAQNAPAILPPVVNIGHGPSGVAYYPGTGLPEEYRGAFFMADFPGGVRSFKLRAKGASYESELPDTVLMDNSIKNPEGKFAWNLNIPDIAFGPGGGLYLLDCVDWIPDFDKFNKGRIFRVHSPQVDAQPEVLETQRLLAEGFSGRSEAELEGLLGHVDVRVRGDAQRALVGRGGAAVAVFEKAAAGGGLKGLHAVWGLGQLCGKESKALEAVRVLAGAEDPELRAQAAKVLGEAGGAEDAPRLAGLLKDSSVRVRFFAAQGLRRVGSAKEVPALLGALPGGDADEPFLRHAVVASLSALSVKGDLQALAASSDVAVRRAAVLALRRNADSGVVDFLKDPEASVRLEAARAIYDEPVEAGLPALAEMAARADEPTGVLQRIQAARYRLGGRVNAERLLKVVADASGVEAARVQALRLLRQWKPEDGRDAFLGRWWPVESNRQFAEVKKLVSAKVPAFLEDSSVEMVDVAVDLAGDYGMKEAAGKLRGLFNDASRRAATRALALNTLAKLNVEGFGDLLHLALSEKNKELSAAAAKLVGKLPPAEAFKLSVRMFDDGATSNAQSAVATVLQLKTPAADAVLGQWMDRLIAGKVPPSLRLDVLEAAGKRGTPALKKKVKAFEAARSPDDALAPWRECLEGGDAKLGQVLFKEKDEVGCYRCHKVGGGGGDVGPAMDKIGATHDREYLLRSIVFPNAEYAPGYETVLLKLADGAVAAGMVAKEDATRIELVTPGTTQRQTIEKDKVAGRDRLPSPMPEGLPQLLSKRELRDLIAYLASQR
jgi:quinoprotein glucose dehydrogenase